MGHVVGSHVLAAPWWPPLLCSKISTFIGIVGMLKALSSWLLIHLTPPQPQWHSFNKYSLGESQVSYVLNRPRIFKSFKSWYKGEEIKNKSIKNLITSCIITLYGYIIHLMCHLWGCLGAFLFFKLYTTLTLIIFQDKYMKILGWCCRTKPMNWISGSNLLEFSKLYAIKIATDL